MKNPTINPASLYWAAFNRFDLRLSGYAVLACSHGGDCELDVKFHSKRVKEQMEKDNFKTRPTPDQIRAELKEYGAWNQEELADDEANFQRIVWLAACDISESDEPDCSAPLTS